MPESIVPELPASLPAKKNRLSRWLGRRLLAAIGWRVSGSFPVEPKVMVALGPHTSNWDFVVAMAALMASGIDVHYLMKKEAFIWPLAPFFRWLGGVPLDRNSSANTVDQIVAQYRNSDQLWVAIAPEGTRRKVAHLKTGFLRIAEQAQVPVLIVAWNYANKEFVLDKLWVTTGDHVADAKAIMQYMHTHFQGRHPERQ